MPIIDAHQHVWDPGRATYEWLTPDLAPIDRRMGFEELRPSLRRAGVQATVLVQAADDVEDTAFMLEVAEQNPEIAAIVAYVPLDRPAEAARQLEVLRENPIIVGVRNLIHDIPDPDWLLRPEVDEGLGLLEEAGLSFDLVSVLPRHLHHAATIAARHPRLRIVIDHLSKPPINLDDHEPWWSLIERAASSPLVYAKVSGLYSATTDAGAWTSDGIRPYVHRALEVFGANRLMYGGDWPISILAGGYDRVWDALSGLFAELGPGEREAILGGTAESFYRIDKELLDRACSVRP